MDRLFFALQPDAETAARIHALALRLRGVLALQGRPLAVERLHVTLCFLGNHPALPPDLVAAADAVAKTLSCAAFELCFDQVMSFGSSRDLSGRATAVVLCCDEDCAPLSALRNQLAAALSRTGKFQLEARSFKPHVTLLYDRHAVSPQEVAATCWTAREFVLVHSLVGKSEHRVLGRYALH
jgi:2'-5' RNA ligase